ncbi:DHA2 family multidrug resistance protein-like MFS transporter [Pseudomonas sp. BIGb0408]|uniref:DHA2 family multidrug resistance protein-like MFS transporter n=1 Tax=Phytopseudomonas flavescens TaxID=29435 RepID=A0A7Y9XMK2_9GAMM|nr:MULTISPECIES: MFS transporter [Pseudomonas]MCW2291296.1 DHA2 family multidrug resistance protein-like MFS transporter [Pseudomonas sp. BIGb0408]NYH74133.1 DHA2 family multidrug resistance protein-like MFS transporter [Pseudomonas flavescens]
MQSPKRWLILAIISSALLLIVIDMTVLYTALPTLTHDLQATASEKLWIINAYSLVAAGLLLGAGTLGDRLGHKRLFVAGLCVFGLASLAAAFSPSAGFLIGARAALAVGAAMMMPATLSIVRLTFTDERERAMAIGIWASVASGGAAFGPVVGGILLEYFWWGSVFLINVPIVLVALVLAVILIPSRPGNAERRWDLIGSLQVMAGLIGIAYAIKELGKREPSLQAALIAFLIGALFMAIFIWRQRRIAQPMLDFVIFRNPGFSAAVVAALTVAAALIGMELVFSQRLQLVLGLSPLQAALFILPLPLASFFAGPLVGHYLPRFGGPRVMLWALLASALGMFAYLLLHNAPSAAQIASLVVLGFGVGAAMTAASSTIMHSAPADQAGMAASLEEVSFELGGAIGVTLLGSILSVIYTIVLVVPAELSVPAQARDSLDEALLIAERLPPEAAAALTSLARSAFDTAFVAVLAVATVLLLLAAVFVKVDKSVHKPFV